MKRKSIYLFILAGLIALSGCLDDKNNYDYTDINELEGEITGMKDEYSISYSEDLTITPAFKFTIDRENPDVSYEWRLDGNLLQGETGPSCTFSFERGGLYEITFSVIDNKTQVRFSRSCRLKVRSPFTRGWVVLSEGGGRQSVLSFVGGRSVTHKMPVTSPDGAETVIIDRDSLVYDYVARDVLPGLGEKPTGLFLNAGHVGSYGELYDVSDEVGVMQERWAELNGTTLERSVYTDQEFRGSFPEAGFHPQAISMTYSAKAMLNSDGYIYWAANSFANDFHTCTYVNFPLGKGRKFTGVYPSYRLNNYHAAIPACTEENEIVGIVDDATPKSFEEPKIQESSYSSNIYSVSLGSYDKNVDENYKLGDWKIVDMMPATPSSDDFGGLQDVRPGHLALLQKGSQYELFYFHWAIGTRRTQSRVYNLERIRFSLDGLSGYTDMAVFNNKQFVLIAEGNSLWYCQYKKDGEQTLKKIYTFDSPVKALAANDIRAVHVEWGNPAVEWQPEHNGQVGVALEDGTYYIYEVLEKSEKREKVTINQLFPDPKAEQPVNNKFDKIVDVIYKYGSVAEFNTFVY